MSNKFPYKKELLHPVWLEKEEAIFKRDKYRCAICGYPFHNKQRFRFWDRRKRKLIVHFRQYLFSISQNKYLDPWLYDEKLLITMDTWCLEKGLRIFKIPIQKIK